MEGQALPVETLTGDKSFTLMWVKDAFGAPTTVDLEAGSEVFFDPENQVFHYRNDRIVRTVTSSIDVRVSDHFKEWEIELQVDPENRLEPPSILITEDQLFLTDNGYNLPLDEFFANACKVLRNRVFNPNESMPPNGEYGSYSCDFETGKVTYYTGEEIFNVPPNGPKKATLKMLRPFAAEARDGSPTELIAGTYEIIPGNYDGRTGKIENWRFDAFEYATLQQDHDRAFVDDEVLMQEFELGHAILVDVIDRRDCTHPMFQ